MLIDCNLFRYGRCNTQVGAMMPAFCGEVACQNPATVSGSNCKSSVAVDDVPSEGSLG
jgi:hypothetical protein